MIALLRRVQEHLDQGKPVRTMSLNAEEQGMLREFWLLTGKPLMVVVNVAESAAREPVPQEIVDRASLAGGDVIAVSARIENDIAELDPADRAGFLHDLGLEEPGLYRVARSAYRLLRLITFFTAGDTEVRAWNLRAGRDCARRCREHPHRHRAWLHSRRGDRCGGVARRRFIRGVA